MKKLLALLLTVSMLVLCGCNNAEDTETSSQETVEDTQLTEESTEERTEETTEEETEETTEAIIYRNPLNGEIIDAPYTGRVFAYSISNTSDALPHVGAIYADVVMEMFVNNTVVRCLGLYSNIAEVDAIGSTRSTRLMFNDIAQHYDAILCHAGGSDQVLNDLNARGLDNFNVEYNNAVTYGASYRDSIYGRGHLHSLFGVGTGLVAYAESRGWRLTQPEDKDYGFLFTEDGTPADGEDAEKISITITYSNIYKETIMSYDAELGKYVYYQYGQKMTDQITGEPESYENVVVMFTGLSMNGNYQVTDFTQGGEGYYACNGKLIPITWTCDGDDAPFRFFTADGEPLAFGVGRTYIAITDLGSKITW